MRRSKAKYIIVLAMVLYSMFYFTGSIFADGVTEAQTEVDNLEEKKKEIETNIKELEKEKGNISSYIEKLDKQLNTLTKDIKTSNANIASAQKTLTVTKADLKVAQETEAKQYKNMKTRIKYMYENGNSDYIDILLNADNISDLLNRSEYIEKISEYDKGILTRYQEQKNIVVDKQTQIETQLKELGTLNEELKLEKDSVNTLIDNKAKELKKYESDITKSEGQIEEFEEEIQKQEDVIEDFLEQERIRIEAQKKKEEAAKAAAKKAAQEKAAAEKAGATAEPTQTTKPADTTDVDENNSSSFRWPLRVSGTITSTFGYRSKPTAGASTYHRGLDIGVATGTPIVASASGSVVSAAYQSAAGNYVMLYHGNSTYTVYMHASALNVSVGQTVKQGDVIAYVGSTGASTGPHLHFGISKNGEYVNPLNYVSR